MANANSTSSRTPKRNAGPDQSGKNGFGPATPIQLKPENPHFRNVTSVPHELAHLLLALPRCASSIKASDEDMKLIAEAAITHADAARLTLSFGLQAIGSLMFVAGTNEEYALEDGELANLGCLIRHLANEVHTMIEIERKFDRVGKEGAA